VTIGRDDEAWYRDFASRLSAMTLDGTAPWLVDRPAGRAEVTYYPFLNPAPIYSGLNAVLLDLVSAERGFSDPRWIPMARMEANRLTPRYGEKPVCLAFRNRFVEVTDLNPVDGTLASALASGARRVSYYYVYNAKQVRGLPPLQKDRATALVRTKTETAMRNSGVRRTSDLLEAFARQLPDYRCPATETLAAIARYRLACQLRLAYKARNDAERLRSESQTAGREGLLLAAYHGANDATRAANEENALVVSRRRTLVRGPRPLSIIVRRPP